MNVLFERLLILQEQKRIKKINEIKKHIRKKKREKNMLQRDFFHCFFYDEKQEIEKEIERNKGFIQKQERQIGNIQKIWDTYNKNTVIGIKQCKKCKYLDKKNKRDVNNIGRCRAPKIYGNLLQNDTIGMSVNGDCFIYWLSKSPAFIKEVNEKRRKNKCQKIV